ncbi:MAG: hypothetical protein IK066_03770, partial [Kiritimatiellae bacterium]|nr:hypothetical protein [Kiritimatiellia bacterium]
IRPLSIRFDSEMRSHRWAPIAIPDPPAFEPLLPGTTNPIPFSIQIRDFTPDPAVSNYPVLLPCLPERMGRSGGMFSILRNGDALRFYGGLTHTDDAPTSSLPPLEWQLLTDSRTSTRTCHFQIAAPSGPDRFIEIDFLLGSHDPDFEPSGMPLSQYDDETVIPCFTDDTTNAPPVTLLLDPAEPRNVEILYDNVARPIGFHVRLALTPSTGNFPRTATVAFDAVPGPSCAPPRAAESLPVPQRILDGDLTGVPQFDPCHFTIPCYPDDFFDALDDMLDLPFAAAALQCPVRDSSLHPVLRHQPPLARTPATTILVNPDPDLKTSLSVGPNQALAILRAIDDLPAPPPAVLFRFDALQPTDLDYSPSALHLCDFPATWSYNDLAAGTLRPAVSLAHAAAEFTATMACLLHRRGIPLLVTPPSWPWAPYLSYHADAVHLPPLAPLPPLSQSSQLSQSSHPSPLNPQN